MMNDAFVKEGTRLLEIIQQAHQHSRDLPLFSNDPSILASLDNIPAIPENPQPLNDIIDEAVAGLKLGLSNMLHPGFMAYFSPRPDLAGLLGDLLAEGFNQTPGAWQGGPFSTVVERHVLAWIAELCGYPVVGGNTPNGIITNGGSMANATAIKLARDKSLANSKQTGLYQQPLLRFYGSEQAHFSIARSIDFCGLGLDNFVTVPCDDDGRIDIALLSQAIKADVAAGFQPCAVFGLAGATATGQVDDLLALRHLCDEFNTWLHVDGAAGAVFATVSETQVLFKGIELADSVCVDPCKWLFQPFGIGCLLVKDGIDLYNSFNISSHYFQEWEEPDFFQMSHTGTRQWRTLGLWFTLKSSGKQGLLKKLQHIRQCARHLEQILSSESSIEMNQHCELAVCVFRLKLNSASDNELNLALQQHLFQQKGFFVTILKDGDEAWIRMSVSNPETTLDDIRQLAQHVIDFASQHLAETKIGE